MSESAKQRYRHVRAYCRVSSDDQAEHGTSLDGQREEIERYCREHGLQQPTFYIEVESGGELAREKRVELKRLVSEAQPSDLVLTCFVDRWTRDIVYTLESVRKLVRSGVRWVAIHDDVDATTDSGMDSLIRKASEAELERSRIRRRTVGTRQRLRKLGYHVEGLPPLGYKVVKRKLAIVPEKAEIVRRMFAMCVDGYSLREIEAVFAEAYPDVPGLDMGAIGRRLRDRRYLGEINTIGTRGRGRPKGEWIKSHEPIIDQETWDRAQRALDARRLSGRPLSGESKTAAFMCRGLLSCPRCGRTVHSWAPQDGASYKHGGYYQCVNKCVRARYADVDAVVASEVLTHLEALARLLAKPAKAKPKPDKTAERMKLVRKRERLVSAIADGIISHEDAKSQMAEIAHKLSALDEPEVPELVDPSERLREIEHIKRAWSTLTPDERRKIVKRLTAKIDLASTATKKWQRGAWDVRIEWKEHQ